VARVTRFFGRGLRFRLTVSYMLFFTVLLVLIGLYFRKTLYVQAEAGVRAALEEQWSAAKAYLDIQNQRPTWIANTSDAEQADTVSRIRRVFLIADANGRALEFDERYASIGIDAPAEISRILRGDPVVHERVDKSGTPYLIKAGRIPDERGRPFFFAIGRSLAPARSTVRDFTRTYFFTLTALIALSGLLGWLMAGRANRPVNPEGTT
jgi:hypothetical protein